MDYLYQAEDKDAVRFSWNLWPSSRIDYKKLVAPLACMYTPLKKTTNLLQMQYNPVTCSRCFAYLNPYCQMEQGCKFWSCPFCTQRNAFPPSYQGISEAHLPAELLPDCTTIEYVQAPLTPVNPVFLFVLDTTMSHAKELPGLVEGLLRALDAVPKDALVGLITYGATVQVYELSYPWMTKTVCFDGSRDYTPQEVQKFLNVGMPTSNGGATPSAANPFILPLKDVEVQLSAILEELQPDPQTFNTREQRAARATGVALSVALSLLQWTFPNTGARVLLMSGGPVTIGPGMIVDRSLKEDIRSHHHLRKETAKHVGVATKFFDSLTDRAVAQGHAVDIFSCSLDQIGLLEMRSLIRLTGGIVVSGESFTHSIFKDSLYKLFRLPTTEPGDLDMAFNANIDLVLSPELKVTGAIGHLASANKKTSHVGESVVGIGGTSSWKICALTAASTYSFYFDIVNAHNNSIPENRYGMIQFRTSYQHPSGARVTRVTTVAHSWSSPARGIQALLPLFDQEATLALVARMVAFRTEQEESDPRGWLDKHLIQLCHTFGLNANKERPELFKLPPELSLYPEFIFHFRRGGFCQVFGNSPDETTYFRYYLLRESVSNTLTMVQPSLDFYALDNEEPTPAVLSSSSLQHDRLLLLDTFFHVVVFSGDIVAKWRNAGYHKQEGYENLSQLMEAPIKDAQSLVANRFPVPFYIECDSGTSQARYLYAVLDPAATHKSTAQPGEGQGGRLGAGVAGEIMYTEDVPLSVFLSHLYKKAATYEG